MLVAKEVMLIAKEVKLDEQEKDILLELKNMRTGRQEILPSGRENSKGSEDEWNTRSVELKAEKAKLEAEKTKLKAETAKLKEHWTVLKDDKRALSIRRDALLGRSAPPSAVVVGEELRDFVLPFGATRRTTASGVSAGSEAG